MKNLVVKENIELRLILTQEDPLYRSFSQIKKSLGIKSNSEVARFIIKQISKIPISKLILDFMNEGPDSIKEKNLTKRVHLTILRDKEMATEDELNELLELEKEE